MGHDDQRKPGAQDSAEKTKEDQALQVQFPRRKRARTEKRKRTALLDEDPDHNEQKEEDEELSRSELMLIKQAQQLRDENRRINLDFRKAATDKQDKEKLTKAPQTNEEDVIGGLATEFAVEQSGHAVEERMGKYIEEKMKVKFGDRAGGDGHLPGASKHSKDENDLYAIPEKLQIPERPTYDPVDGLPAAGVEEVDLPEEVREKNVRETARARRGLLTGKRQKRGEELEATTLPGNLSANFIEHRSEWIAENLASKHSNISRENVAEGSERTGREKTERRRKGFQTATDGLVAERFKKKWRK